MNNQPAVFECYMRKGIYIVRLGKVSGPDFCNLFLWTRQNWGRVPERKICMVNLVCAFLLIGSMATITRYIIFQPTSRCAYGTGG